MSKHRTWTILRSDMALISQFGIGNSEFESQSTPLEHHALSSVGSAAEIASTMIRAPSSCLPPQNQNRGDPKVCISPAHRMLTFRRTVLSPCRPFDEVVASREKQP